LGSIGISGVVFACTFGSALAALLLRSRLPEGHLSEDTKDVVKLGIALVATMAALVLGLLTASAKGAYDARGKQILQISADVILLDSTLAHYGPEADRARAMLRASVAAAIDQFWPARGGPPAMLDRRATSVEGVVDEIQRIAPRDDAQRGYHAQAMAVAFDLARTRVLLFQELGDSIPAPFLVVLASWLCVIFASFGLFAPRNGTVLATLCVCALSVAGAVLLILELERPFSGLFQVSEAPLRAALAQLGP
jgi:Protein of unknown function (DUF4239)